jgi:hypothetical protein
MEAFFPFGKALKSGYKIPDIFQNTSQVDKKYPPQKAEYFFDPI